jgi:hypothetical protein
MATFMEAMQAAREGKRVRCNRAHWMKADGRFMVWSPELDDCVYLTLDMFDAEWEIEQPPSKRYTFLEAVALMEQHKARVMKSLLTDYSFSLAVYDTQLFCEAAQRGPTIQEMQGSWEAR